MKIRLRRLADQQTPRACDELSGGLLSSSGVTFSTIPDHSRSLTRPDYARILYPLLRRNRFFLPFFFSPAIIRRPY
jgi:hypothetical protein